MVTEEMLYDNISLSIDFKRDWSVAYVKKNGEK